MENPLKAENVKLLYSGNDFFNEFINIIDEAKEIIHLQTFIFSFDGTGKEIGEHLMKAAKRGVRVYLLADGYGSKELPNVFVEELKAAGIHFRFFSPFLSSENVSIVRRIHHKILVADKNISVIGGINIGNKYHGSPTVIPWLDFAILVKGDCNRALDEYCDAIYNKIKSININSQSSGKISIRFRINDWLKGKNEIHNSYKHGVSNSKHSITMMASYFLPGYFFIKRLNKAAKKGVKIKIVVGGISDIALFHHAEKYLYPYLIKNGIEIYEWNDSVMHGKLAIFDEHWATIGSYNLNNLSKYQCIELNVDVSSPIFCKTISNDLQQLMQNKCKRITQKELAKQSNFFQKIKSTFAYYLYKLFMYLIVPVE